MDLKALIAVISSVVAIASVLGAATVVFRVSYVKAQLEGLRGDRDDLTKRVGLLEDENSRLKTDNTSLIERLDVLEKLVTGRDMIKELSDELKKRYLLADTSFQEIKDLIHGLKAGS